MIGVPVLARWVNVLDDLDPSVLTCPIRLFL
jgi:hypothetical protein